MPFFSRSALKDGVAMREVWSWAAFDFANSGYTTVVLTAVFNAYFVSVVAVASATVPMTGISSMLTALLTAMTTVQRNVAEGASPATTLTK